MRPIPERCRRPAWLDAGNRGFVLVAITVGAFFLFGMVGLAVDLGRMYIARNETQSLVDGAALAAASKLDDTPGGVTAATAAANAVPKQYNLGTSAYSGLTIEFATDKNGPWTATPPNPPTSYYCARVSTSANLPLWLLPVLTREFTGTVGAMAVAGRLPLDSITDGAFPYSPFSHKILGHESVDNSSDPFGMQQGQLYTLRWAPSPKISNGNTCPGDTTQNMIDVSNATPAADRGYFQLNSANDIRDSIQANLTADPPLQLGGTVNMSGGAKNTEQDAIIARVNQDTDTTAPNWTAYKAANNGNMRRVVAMPINGGPPNFQIVGFAGFFLLPASNYQNINGNMPACAEYIGSWVLGGSGPGAPGGGAFKLRLLQ